MMGLASSLRTTVLWPSRFPMKTSSTRTTRMEVDTAQKLGSGWTLCCCRGTAFNLKPKWLPEFGTCDARAFRVPRHPQLSRAHSGAVIKNKIRWFDSIKMDQHCPLLAFSTGIDSEYMEADRLGKGQNAKHPRAVVSCHPSPWNLLVWRLTGSRKEPCTRWGRDRADRTPVSGLGNFKESWKSQRMWGHAELFPLFCYSRCLSQPPGVCSEDVVGAGIEPLVWRVSHQKSCGPTTMGSTPAFTFTLAGVFLAVIRFL